MKACTEEHTAVAAEQQWLAVAAEHKMGHKEVDKLERRPKETLVLIINQENLLDADRLASRHALRSTLLLLLDNDNLK